MLVALELFEIGILNFIQNVFGCGFLDWLMVRITRLGDGGMVWIILGIALACTKRYRRNGIVLLAGLLLGLILGNLILKNLVARQRPFDVADIRVLVAKPTDFSFPSGHTLSSFIAAFVLWNTNKARFGIAAVCLACLIAFSRLYIGVHFPSDVLCGIALAYIIYLIIRRQLVSENSKE